MQAAWSYAHVWLCSCRIVLPPITSRPARLQASRPSTNLRTSRAGLQSRHGSVLLRDLWNTAPKMSDNAEIPLLDGKHYALDGEELAFFKSQTGIQDEHALKAHIMKVQTEAYKVGDYCSSRRTRDREMRAARFIDIVVYFASTLSSAFVSSATAAHA